MNFLKKNSKTLFKFFKLRNKHFSTSLKNTDKTSSLEDLKHSEKDKYFSEYLKNFKSITKYKNPKLIDLVTSREFISVNYLLLKHRFEEAEKVLESLKYYLRPTHISTHIYSVVLRRLGICKLNSKKIKEGLMELENAYEFSKNKENNSYKIRLASKLELLKAYITHDKLKASKFAEELLKEESEIKLLDPEELASLYTLAAYSFFIKSSKNFEKIKTLLRKSINYTQDPTFKAVILHNISVILYYECKSHNKYLDNMKKIKQKENEMENRKENDKNYSNTSNDDESRIKRKFSKEDLKFLEREKKEIEKIKLSDIPSQDSFYKKLVTLHSQEFKNREKNIQKISKYFQQEQSNKTKDDEIKIEEESLKGSKFDKNEKVDLILYNIENYGELKDIEKKLMYSDVNYESDLDSLLPNLFLSLKFNNIESSEYFVPENNFSQKMNLENFLILYKPFFTWLTSNLKNSESIEKEKEKELKTYLNKRRNIIEVDEIDEFREIIEKDEFFTLVKNPASIKTILFLAELFTENSKNYKEESEYFIKYAIILSLNSSDGNTLIRAYTLACAYMIDNLDDISSADRLLTFLYEQANEKKESLDEVTYTMICHLLGAMLKCKPKSIGEGLALLEYAKNMRNYQQEDERLFFLIIPEFSFNNDYDAETMRYISDQIQSNSSADNLNNFL